MGWRGWRAEHLRDLWVLFERVREEDERAAAALHLLWADTTDTEHQRVNVCVSITQ